MKDIIIIGAGPAGLAAAVYARRADKTVLLLEKNGFGGQMTFSPKIENFPGEVSISGTELADKMVEQALSQGAETELEEALSVTVNPDGTKTVKTDCGEYDARAVIIATGAKHRLLSVPGEKELVGNGISFCAVCDGAFYSGKSVVVVGGGNSALQEALLLSEICESVTVVQNLEAFTGEARLVQALTAKSNVHCIFGAAVTGFIPPEEEGHPVGTEIRLSDGNSETLFTDGVFVAIGLAPDTKVAQGVAETDKYGYIISDERCLTGGNGVFVAGDCRTKRIRQIVTAASDGATAALAAIAYIEGR